MPLLPKIPAEELMRATTQRMIFAVVATLALPGGTSSAQSVTMQTPALSRLHQHHGHTGQVAMSPTTNEQGTTGFKFLPIDVTNAAGTLATGINARGDIVGIYFDAAFNEHGFSLKDGKFATIDVPGSVVGVSGTLETEANGINPAGDIVGDYFAPPGAPGAPECLIALSPACRRGFLYKNGRFSDVLVPGKKGSIPNAITPDGAIYGCDHDDDYFASMFGFVRTPLGLFMTMNAGGGELANPAHSVAGSMNNGATPDGRIIVGLYVDPPSQAGKYHGYIVEDGNFHRYDVPDSTLTQIWGIDAKADFVGLYDDIGGSEHGFLQRRGTADPITIDVPSASPFNSVLTDAFAINPSGVIVGLYIDTAGNLHGYAAVPTNH